MAIKLPENKNYMWGMLIIIAILAGVSVSLYLQTVSLNRQLTTLEAKGPPTKGDCPDPFVQDGNSCVLTANAILTSTLELASGTTLDCQGNTLSPSVEGLAQSGSNPLRESVPLTAIVLNDVKSVTIKNCVIDDFDFGILAVNHEAEDLSRKNRDKQQNTITGNTLTSLYQGITIIEADNMLIEKNTIASQSDVGAGINILLDSDNLTIRNNSMKSSSGGNANPAPLFPGSPIFFSLIGSLITFPTSLDTIDVQAGSEVIRFTKDRPRTPDGDLVDYATNNLIENNRLISRPKAALNLGVEVSEYQDGLIIRANTIENGVEGILLGLCQLCDPRVVNEEEAYWPRNVVIENNILSGQTFVGISADETFNPIIRNNVISGITQSFDFKAGISLIGKALETATVTRNIVKDSPQGILIATGNPDPRKAFDDAEFFGAKVYLNDFVNVDAPLVVFSYHLGPPYTIPPFPNDLSFNGQGNYWDRTCDDSDGFRDADEPDQSQKTDANSSLDGFADNSAFGTDSHPYGQPVAGLSSKELARVDTCL